MISFRVDGRSGVAPYLQIVRQVRQALRMGVLDVGDQLPSFVRARPPGPPGTHSRLGRSLARWVREAREAGLDEESMESLLRVTLRAADAADSGSEEIA